MLVGAIDPLEGSFVILPASGVVALGGFLGKSRYRKVLYAAFILIAAGFGAMIIMTMMGGIGGRTGRSMWWGLLCLPYPIGWVVGLVGVILRLVEAFKRSSQEKVIYS
jgi:hypothetical protein